MADMSFDCSIDQGFNFHPDEQDYVGHLTTLTIGGVEMAANMKVTDPTDSTGDNVPVVGVLSDIYWNGGYADGISFSAQVNVDNKTELAKLQHSDLSNTEVLFSFKVFAYDQAAKKFYLALHSNDADLEGLVEKQGSELNFNIDMVESPEVANPLNFTLTLGVMPKEVAMEIHMAVSDTDKFVKQWGVQVS